MKLFEKYSNCQRVFAVKLLTIIIWLLCQVSVQSFDGGNKWMPTGGPIASGYPCKNTRDIIVHFDGVTLSSEEVNQYYVYLNLPLTADSHVRVTFDADVSIAYAYRYGWKSDYLQAGNILHILSINTDSSLNFKVTGIKPGLPNLVSFKIHQLEYCLEPDTKFLMEYIKDRYVPKDTSYKFTVSDNSGLSSFQCGRRKTIDTGSVENGEVNPGDWPWHAALYRQENGKQTYICGATLISHNYVITAAHCTHLSKDDSAARYIVVLGKHNLLESNNNKTIEIYVEKSFASPIFLSETLFNDIALVKLKSEVQFTDDIQPACLWYKRYKANVSTDENMVGILAGWGITNDNNLPAPLQQVNLPIVTTETCLRSHPLYNKIMNDNDFCAGYHNNGTAPCKGDSGGALQLFIPDPKDVTNTKPSGAWYVRGILSKSIPRVAANTLCDDNQYAVFTDVDKFGPWIDSHLD